MEIQKRHFFNEPYLLGKQESGLLLNCNHRTGRNLAGRRVIDQGKNNSPRGTNAKTETTGGKEVQSLVHPGAEVDSEPRDRKESPWGLVFTSGPREVGNSRDCTVTTWL